MGYQNHENSLGFSLFFNADGRSDREKWRS